MARAQATLWFCGGLMTLAGLAAPRPPGADELQLLVLAGSSLLGSGVLWLAADRVNFGAILMGAVVGTLGIGLGMYFWRESGTEVDLLYIWVVLYAFYFFGRAWGLGFTALTGVTYAVGLAVSDPAGAPALAWLDLVGTALGAGIVISMLSDRINSLMAALGRAAETDTLTGLINRRGFEVLCDAELARATTAGEPLGVLIADIDHFKSINDRFGHAAGDAALLHIADRLRAIVRPGDIAARIGGEEFVVVAANASTTEALRLAEKLREAVAAFPQDEVGQLTISLGVASAPLNGRDRAHLLAAADAALYTAKEEGRNRARSAAPNRGTSAVGPALVL